MSLSVWLTNLENLPRDVVLMDLDELAKLEQAILPAVWIVIWARHRRSQIPRGGIFHRLPREIRMGIFERCLPIDDWKSAVDMPQALASVSRQWREDALMTPHIWSNVDIRGRNWTEFFCSLTRGNTRLTRSKQTDVRVSVKIPFGSTTMILDVCDWVMRLVRDHLGHIEELSIAAFGGDFIPNALAYLQGPAPILTSFHINVSDWAGGDTEGVQALANTLFANMAPSLSVATLPSFRIRWPMSILNNLTTLGIADCGGLRMGRVLQFFAIPLPRLEMVDLSNIRVIDGFTHVHTPPITNPSIRSLFLDGQTFGDTAALLGKLDLPNLHTHQEKIPQLFSAVQVIMVKKVVNTPRGPGINGLSVQ